MTTFNVKAHNDLLLEWSDLSHHRNKGFIRDGVIDPKRWDNAKIKILFILKEAYGEEGKNDDWDLTDYIINEWEGPFNRLWTVAYWLFGIHNLGKIQLEISQKIANMIFAESIFCHRQLSILKKAPVSPIPLRKISKIMLQPMVYI